MKKESKVNTVDDGKGSRNHALGIFMYSFIHDIRVPFLVLVFKLWKTCPFSLSLRACLGVQGGRWGSEAVAICPEVRNKSYSAFHMKVLAVVF